jgi:hypothetical protein
MRNRLLQLAVIALILPSVVPASADEPPYPEGSHFKCWSYPQPAGTEWDYERLTSSVDSETGELQASVIVGGELPSDPEPFPHAGCGGASVGIDWIQAEQTASYLVTAHFRTLPGVDAPMARVHGVHEAVPPPKTESTIEVVVGALALSCDDSTCIGYGPASSRLLACAPYRVDWAGRPCSSAYEFTLSARVEVEQGEFLAADVSLIAFVNSGYLGRAEASARVIVEEISIEIVPEGSGAADSAGLCTLTLTDSARTKSCSHSDESLTFTM